MTTNKTSNTPLEIRYADLVFQDMNVWWKKCDFQDYTRTQNEWPPQNIQPHLGQSAPGAMVVTGTERGFFNLLFSDEGLCIGLIFRDINPKAKAYIDFNTLLLRISQNMQEYTKLSEPIEWWRDDYDAIMSKRIALITEKTQMSDLPERVQKYYLKNIKRLGESYLHLGQSGDWRKDERLRACWYHQNEEQFLKLQRYAKAGNIIATVGDINDLEFLKETKISTVDTSNIHDYCVVNLKGAPDFSPKVIWTELFLGETKYYSSPYTPHEPLNAEEDKEFQMWISLFQKTHPEIGKNKHYFQIVTEKLKLEASSFRNNPKEVLSKLRKYMQESVLTDPDQRIVNDPTLGYVPLSNLSTINTLSIKQMHILCRNPQTWQHLSFLIGKISSLKTEHYLALMKIPGAKDEFEKQCLQLKINFDYLNVFPEMQLKTLIQEFGPTRFAILKKRVALSRLLQATQKMLPSPAKIGIFVVGLAVIGSYWAVNSVSLTPSE
ncbi:MAG TPA: hypothetical protein VFU89_06880 [Rhabdochlamydiaceae bacterium]|nr:hypothetical protein [Rhabdochlamydiaceae bacterium]